MFHRRKPNESEHLALPSKWRDISSQIIDYSLWHESFSKALREPRSLIVTGRPGLGKSTYILWAISRSITGQIKTWFSKAVFLDRLRQDDWPSCDSLHRMGLRRDDTVVIVDSPFELDEDESARFKKLQKVRPLLDGFHVIMTMRDDEYQSHAKQLLDFELPILEWESVRFSQILQTRLLAWGGPHIALDKLDPLEAILRVTSDGAPIYLELLANALSEEGRIHSLTVDKLSPILEEQLPKGMVNLIWQIVTRISGQQHLDNDPLLFLLKLLHRTGTSLSNHFQINTINFLTTADRPNRPTLLHQLSRLTNYLASGTRKDPVDLEDTRFFSLRSQWREALSCAKASDLTQIDTIYHETVQRFMSVDHKDVLHNVTQQIAARLKSGVYSVPHAVLCSDIVKCHAQNSGDVTGYYIGSRAQLSKNTSRNQLDNLLFDAWLARAFSPAEQLDAFSSFDAAFSLSLTFDTLLRLDHETKPLNYYITHRKYYLLPRLEGVAFESALTETVALCQRLIDLDPHDAASRRSLANLHISIKDYQTADRIFAEMKFLCSTSSLEHVFTLIEWGNCLRKWATDSQAELYRPADSYLFDSLQKFNEAALSLAMLRGQSADIRAIQGGIPEAESRLLRTRAKALEAASLWPEAEELWEKSIHQNSDDPSSVNGLANLLLNTGRAARAKELLTNLIASTTRVPDAVSLQLLARCQLSDEPYDYHSAEQILSRANESAQQGRSYFAQKSYLVRISHDFAKLYLSWLSNSTPTEASVLLPKLRASLRETQDLPRNPLWAPHFAAIHSTLMKVALVDDESPNLRRSVSPIDLSSNDWYNNAVCSASAFDWDEVIIAYHGWLESLRERDAEWNRGTTPEKVCNMLRIAGIAHGARAIAEPTLFAGRYYASICNLIRRQYPISVNKYPTTQKSAIYRREREIGAARAGDLSARTARIASLKVRSRTRDTNQLQLNRALLEELQGNSQAARETYVRLANSILEGRWTQSPPTALRVLADGLYSFGELSLTLDLWKRVHEVVDFPESLFVSTLVNLLINTPFV